MNGAEGIRRVAVRVMCYDEQQTICEVVRRLLSAVLPAGHAVQIEIIDDGSTDDSVARVHAAFGEDPRVSVFMHRQRRGLGAVLRRAFRPTDADVVVLLCGDLQFAPEDVVPLLEALDGADMVIALRPNRQDATSRRLLTRFEHGLSWALLGCAYPDIHWVRAVRGHFLRDVRFVSRSPTIDQELALHIRKNGGRITTLPLPHHRRRFGKSKATTVRALARTTFDLLNLARRRVQEKAKKA